MKKCNGKIERTQWNSHQGIAVEIQGIDGGKDGHVLYIESFPGRRTFTLEHDQEMTLIRYYIYITVYKPTSTHRKFATLINHHFTTWLNWLTGYLALACL